MVNTERRATMIRLIVAPTILIGGYLGLCAWSAQHVPSNVSVGGIQIGGMTPDEARQAIDRGSRTLLTSPIALRLPASGGSADSADAGDPADAEGAVDVVPAEAGFRIDVDRTLDGLTGFTLDPSTVWSKLTGSVRAPLLTAVDDDILSAHLATLAPRFAAGAVDGGITFPGGKVTVTPPVPGRALDIPGTKLALRRAFPDSTTATAALSPVAPQIGADALARARADFADPAMSGPISIVSSGAPVPVAPADFAPAVSMVPDGSGGLTPKFDAAKLRDIAAKKATAKTRASRDATWKFVDGRPRLVPSVDGIAVDEASIPGQMIAALTSADRTVRIKTVVTKPKFTTADAKKAGIKTLIVDFRSPFPPEDVTRTHNLVVATKRINGTYVGPGETFSLNGILGERTTAKGYKDGTVIINGRLTRGTGGGISQVSTTIYNMAYFAGVDILEFTAHAFFIPRYPEGREATVFWPNVDNKWKNDTPYGMLLQTWVADGHVHGRIWSTKYWDIKSVKGPRRNVVEPEDIKDNSLKCYPQQPNPGFDVTVRRLWYRPGSSVLVKHEDVTTHYIPEDRITCTNPDAKP